MTRRINNTEVSNVSLNGILVFGIIDGNSVIEIFIPQLVELHRQGRFPFDKLVKLRSRADRPSG